MDPTKGWRGSRAGRGRPSRRKAAPEQPVCPDQGVGSRRQCQGGNTSSGAVVCCLTPGLGREVFWPTGATSRVPWSPLRFLPQLLLILLIQRTPLEWESRGCQVHKGVGDPRQVDRGGAVMDKQTRQPNVEKETTVRDADISLDTGSSVLPSISSSSHEIGSGRPACRRIC